MDGHHEKAIKFFYKNFLNQSLIAASNSHQKIFLILNLIFDHYLKFNKIRAVLTSEIPPLGYTLQLLILSSVLKGDIF